MQKTILLLNYEYKVLFESGGDDLIAFFATCRFRKNQLKEQPRLKPRESLTGAITRISGLSRNSVYKYLTRLVKIGLITERNGLILIRGRNWSKRNLTKQNKIKLIPIIVCDKFTDTKSSSYYVRIHSNIKSQEKQILKKVDRIQIINQHDSGNIRNLKDLKRAKSLIKKGLSVSSIEKSKRSTTISNNKFSKLKKGTESKRTGNYQKTKLLKRRLISQSRNVSLYLKGVFSLSAVYGFNESVIRGGFFVGKEGIYFEVSPTISLVD